MSTKSSFGCIQGSFPQKLSIALGYGLVILAIYYLSVYFLDYPYVDTPYTTVVSYERVVREAFGEEALYRLIPLWAVISLCGVNWFILIPAIGLSSLLFALGHLEWISIVPVGIPGVILSIAFLQFGGYDKDYTSGLLWTGFIHVSVNLSILVFVPILISL